MDAFLLGHGVQVYAYAEPDSNIFIFVLHFYHVFSLYNM